jgi:penicillin-binding protein 2
LSFQYRRSSPLHTLLVHWVAILVAVVWGAAWLPGAAPKKKSSKSARHAATAKPAAKPPAAIAPVIAKSTRRKARTRRTRTTRARSVARGPWRVPTYADSTDGDRVDGEDLVARRAAVDALGKLNGTVVVADPSTGRILTIVNQQLALMASSPAPR